MGDISSMSSQIRPPEWLDVYNNTLGNYELEPESDEEESIFKKQLLALKKEKEKEKENNSASPWDPDNNITLEKINLALVQLESDKQKRDVLKEGKKINQNLLKKNPGMSEDEKKEIEKHIAKLDFQLPQVSASSTVKKELYTKMRVGELFSGENECGRVVLHEGATSKNFKARHDFIAYLKSHNDLLPQNQAEAQNGMISMAELLTPEGVILYEFACKEERDSIAFREAVFISSTKTYGGKNGIKNSLDG